MKFLAISAQMVGCGVPTSKGSTTFDLANFYWKMHEIEEISPQHCNALVFATTTIQHPQMEAHCLDPFTDRMTDRF